MSLTAGEESSSAWHEAFVSIIQGESEVSESHSRLCRTMMTKIVDEMRRRRRRWWWMMMHSRDENNSNGV